MNSGANAVPSWNNKKCFTLSTTSDPYCCAHTILGSFPSDSGMLSYDKGFGHDSKRAMKELIAEKIEEKRNSGYSIMTATVIPIQSLAEKFLIEAGFVCSTPDWMYRYKGSSNRTGVKHYVLVLNPELKG